MTDIALRRGYRPRARLRRTRCGWRSRARAIAPKRRFKAYGIAASSSTTTVSGRSAGRHPHAGLAGLLPAPLVLDVPVKAEEIDPQATSAPSWLEGRRLRQRRARDALSGRVPGRGRSPADRKLPTRCSSSSGAGDYFGRPSASRRSFPGGKGRCKRPGPAVGRRRPLPQGLTGRRTSASAPGTGDAQRAILEGDGFHFQRHSGDDFAERH